MSDLRSNTWFFEKYNVLSIQTDISLTFALMENILCNVQDTQVFMMTLSPENKSIITSFDDSRMRSSKIINFFLSLSCE